MTFLKKKSCNQSISQPKIIQAPPSPVQARKISNPTILARVSSKFSCALSTPLAMFAEGVEVALSLSLPLSAKILNSFAGISVFYGKSFELCKKNCCVEVSMWIFFFSVGFSCMDWSKGCVFMWVLL